MSNIPAVKVTARFSDPEGRPLRGAIVSMRLTTTERYQGYVVPAEVRGVTDGSGRAVLSVWPNELGTEQSEYLVTVTFPENCTVPGGTPGRVSARTIRAYAVVPNADCLLHDIMELPPYEQRGAGQIISLEVAAYADAAAHHADEARSAVDEAKAVETRLSAAADAAEAAKSAAVQARKTAEASAKSAAKTVDGFETEVRAERDSVIKAVNDVVHQRKAEALSRISQAETVALNAMEQRAGEALSEASQTISDARTEAVSAVNNAGRRALTEIGAAGEDELQKLRDEAALFGEDFENLTERALAAAKRAGCSAASAANGATKACECATRAERAAQGMERYRDDALDAARRAENAEACAGADAARAEAAANSARRDADIAEDAARAAKKSAEAAEAGAKDANLAATQSLAARQATARDREYLDGIVDDARRAVHDVAVDLLTPEVVADAVQQATQTARDAANAAGEKSAEARASATEAAGQARLAGENAVGAENARDAAQTARAGAEDAAARAESVAEKLLSELTAQKNIVAMSGHVIRTSDRVTKLELAHAAGDADWNWPGSGGSTTVTGALDPAGVEISPHVTVAPLTIVEKGGNAPSGAALSIRVEDYEGVSARS